jgi:site-specific DNA-cytosine methylase
MLVLIACEESQAVTKAFRKLGHQAYSCDILPCSGGHPEWHIQGDAIKEAYSRKYDLMVAHPPCTYLSVSGARWMYNKDGSINKDRLQKQNEALFFVKQLMDAPIKHIAIENPVSVISSQIRKPDDIVHPWMFGDEASKKTCLWLKNLPKLKATNLVSKGEYVTFSSGKRMAKWYNEARGGKDRSKNRSKTFPGIAEAMAIQYSDYFLNSIGF